MAEIDKRLRYYNGQFLQERDFTDEQQYHLDRQRRHNRLLHSPGIADGLTVTVAARSVTVAPGTAIDENGRTIVLTESRSESIGESSGNQPFLVVIAYGEEPSDPAKVGDAGNTRWLERPEVRVIPEPEAPAEGTYIRLARLYLADNGTIARHDETVRRSAGKLGTGTLEVQNPLGATAQFIQDQNGTRSALAVGTGKVGVGTKNPGHVFSVVGDTSFGPTMELRSTGNDASIQYANHDEEGVWRAGVGPENNFFFWNQKKNASALFTPEGTLVANNLATPDGRDIKADRAKLDALSSTLKGVSNPGGNVDLIGENGITVTGDDTANTIKVSNASGSLAVPDGVKGDPAFVRDQRGTPSALAIGTEKVGIGTDELECVLTIAGHVSTGPMVEARSQGNEASIRYVKDNGEVWHAGVGPANNFFFWNKKNNTSAHITPEGVLTVKGLNLNGWDVGADGARLDTLASSDGILKVLGQLGATLEPVRDQKGNASPLAIGTADVEIRAGADKSCVFRVDGNIKAAPLMEIYNQKDEATIRYVDSAGKGWHVGTGEAGGAKSFFFWHQEHGVVAAVSPEGDLTIKGKIVLAGTVDDRDISADGAKLDKLERSTLEGVSNPGGNVDLVGRNGITVTGDNAAKTITIASPAGSLGVPDQLIPGNQFVRDQNGNVSGLSLGSGRHVGVGTETPGFPFTVAGDVQSAPLMEIHNVKDEASIRYRAVAGGTDWHVGVGGHGGPGSFFFWNNHDNKPTIIGTITPDGTWTLKGGLVVEGKITVNGRFENILPQSAAPDLNRLKALKFDPQTGKIYYEGSGIVYINAQPDF